MPLPPGAMFWEFGFHGGASEIDGILEKGVRVLPLLSLCLGGVRPSTSSSLSIFLSRVSRRSPAFPRVFFSFSLRWAKGREGRHVGLEKKKLEGALPTRPPATFSFVASCFSSYLFFAAVISYPHTQCSHTDALLFSCCLPLF